MQVYLLVPHVLTAATLAAALAIVFTAPAACILPTFVTGLAAYTVRDVLTAGGMHDSGATVFAVATAVLVGVAVTPRRLAATVVVIAAIFPLSAGVALLDALGDLMKMSTYQGAELRVAAISFGANLARAFSTFAAIAIGLEIGIAAVGAFRHSSET